MPAFSRICQNALWLAGLSLMCLAAPAHSETRQAKPLSGHDIRNVISGAKVHIHTPLGSVIPVDVGADGSLYGTAGNVAFYLGSQTDRGRWWIAGSKLCQKWRVWFERKSNCMTVRKVGAKLYWRDNDGDTGVATLVSRPKVARKPKEKRQAKKITTAAYGLGFPPTFKGHIGDLYDGSEALPTAPARTQSISKDLRRTVSTRAVSKPEQNLSAPRRTTDENAAGTTFRVVRVAASDMLNLRQHPSMLAPLVGTIAADATGIRLLGQCDQTWCRVAYQQKRGWVGREFLAVDVAPQPARAHEIWRRDLRYKVVRVSGNDVLNVRDKPSAETRIAGTIPAGADGIRITGTCVAEWCPIAHGGRKGWVHRYFISPVHLPPRRYR